MVMRSLERGQIWEKIAAALNSLQQPKFRVIASQELQNKNKKCATERKPPESNNTGRKEQ